MSRLVIIADVHGHYDKWKKIKTILKNGDILVVAGDLFDTKYGGQRVNPFYHPQRIKEEYEALPNKKYYVYGNCDTSEFFEGGQYIEEFNFNERKILLTHGDVPYDGTDCDIIISGHTHIPELKKVNNKTYINPGSLAIPKEGRITYALIQDDKAMLLDLNNAEAIIKSLDLD